MARRRSQKVSRSNDPAKRQTTKEVDRRQWWRAHSPVKFVIVFVIMTVGPVLIFKDFGFITERSAGADNTNDNTSEANSSDQRVIDPLGGWRPVDEDTMRVYGSAVCTIERVSVRDLPPDRFESEFRLKKPVIVTFPDGARDWTVPDKWTRDSLLEEYGKWQLRSGTSLEIVRKGGNAQNSSSVASFIHKLMSESKPSSKEPMHYGFDRYFYQRSNLPQTLNMPPYFKVNDSVDESIFFLGISTTGVVFHKHSDTWNGVVFGNKRWFLYNSTHTPPGGVYHGFSLIEWVENVYPTLSDADKPMECVQGPGEILYLPEGTYHATLNLGDTIAVALQKKDAVIPTEILFYEATKLMNLLGDDSKTDKHQQYNERLLEIYQELSHILPDNSEVMMKLGDKLHDLGRYSEAIPWHLKAIDRDRHFVVAYCNLGRSLAKLRQYEEAEVMFLKAKEMNPNLWDVYKDYGEFLLRQGRPADALPMFRKGTELRPDLVPFWFYLKVCLEKVGDLEAAEDVGRQIEKLKADKK